MYHMHKNYEFLLFLLGDPIGLPVSVIDSALGQTQAVKDLFRGLRALSSYFSVNF